MLGRYELGALDPEEEEILRQQASSFVPTQPVQNVTPTADEVQTSDEIVEPQYYQDGTVVQSNEDGTVTEVESILGMEIPDQDGSQLHFEHYGIDTPHDFSAPPAETAVVPKPQTSAAAMSRAKKAGILAAVGAGLWAAVKFIK